MSAEFKIGRLRYTWKGYWDTNVEYNRDAVVNYNGKTYVCLYPHTSTNFYEDLTYSNPVEGNVPRWLLMIDGRAWKQAWEPNTYYFFGNIVTYGGIVYICTDQHTSAAAQIDLSKWTTYSSFDNWDSNWTATTVYGLGDIVRYGGIVYRCIEDHVSSGSTAAGLEADQAKWEVVNAGIEYKGDWVQGFRYKLNDLSKNGTDIYKCIAGHTSSTLFDATKWELWFPGQEFTGQWNQSAIYQPGDIVVYGGYSYVCKTINNQNIIPTVSGVDWELVTLGYQMKNQWASDESYKVGDVVRRGGQLFTAISDSTGEDPTDYSVTAIVDSGVGNQLTVQSTTNIVRGMTIIGTGFTQGQMVVSVDSPTSLTISDPPNSTIVVGQSINFVGVNHLFWTMVVPGARWLNFWQENVSYVSGEIVSWQNVTYRCTKTHVSSTISRPDTDTTNSLWTVYLIHAKENAGNTLGDLVSFAGTAPQAIHILPDGAVLDATENYLLKISGTQPNWKTIFAVPDVFYVAPTGTDRLDFGKTWDEPWKTINYACQQINNGFFYQNANEILERNKEFLIEEMYQWMLYQKQNNLTPFTSSSTFDEAATRRDAKFVIDALSHDIVRGSNSRIVTAARAYFKENSDQTFFNDATDQAQLYIVASLEYLKLILSNVISNLDVTVSYQNLKITWNEGTTYNTGDIVYYEGSYFVSLVDGNIDFLDVIESWEVMYDVPPGIIAQYKSLLAAEPNAYLEISSLLDILIYAITNATTTKLPRINEGASATIFIKTGTYPEQIPIVVPDNTSLVGDELRGTVIQPLKSVYTSTKSASSLTNRFTFQSVENLEVGMPIQFSAATVNDDFGGVNLGFTYYVTAIVNKTVAVSLTPGGDPVTLISGVGLMTVYAGDCLKDMFYMHNSTGLRNMTLTGLAGSLSEPNTFTTRRPTGGAYVSLDPGNGPDDTRTWIVSRSPYMQNVTNFGVGCVGAKIDGTLHNGGNRSMVANDFTQIISDGIGVWCKGTKSLTELVSVFCYYNYAGYFAEDGGRIRATNGNSSYGVYGVIAEGYDDTEIPISGKIDNRSSQVQASVQSAFGTAAELLSLEFVNAGSNYVEQTTNLLKQSNHFNETAWVSDGNVSIQQNTTSPFGYTDAWTLTGTTSGTETSYIYQNISILPAGSLFTNVPTLNITGSGVGATFDVTVTAVGYTAIVNTGGSNYANLNELRIPGSTFGGVDGTNDCFLMVTSLAGSSVLNVEVLGEVPSNSDQSYTFSVYAKQGTSSSFDIEAIYSGSSTLSTVLTYNFNTSTFTTNVSSGAALPKNYDKLELSNGWYRFSVTFYDKSAQNNALQIRIWPRSKSGLSGSTRFYGTQLQLTNAPTFYLETTTNQFTSNANFKVVGAGTGADLLGDEVRSKSVFENRITDTGTGVGGRGYLVASNNAQGGDDTNIILAGSDTNIETNYIGMRIFIESGTGAGQYGYISSYDDSLSKIAYVLKESFDPLKIVAADNASGILTLESGYNTSSLYVDQLVQFIPTYYTTTLSRTGIDSLEVTAVIGGSTNTMTVSNTAKLSVNMPIRFSGSVFGGVTTDFTYFVREILDSTTFTISTEIFGALWLLNSGSGSMTMTFPGYNNYITASTSNMDINMPVHFTGLTIGGISVGATYYVNEVIDANTFTISTTLVENDVTATSAGTNYLTTGSTTTLVPLNPIKFTGTVFGNIVAGNKYFVNKIINSTTFTISSSIIETRASATETLTNLITVESTSGFVANNPIQFIGRTTGGIVNGTTYYILAINSGTTFTISGTPGGSAINLSTSVCDVLVRTTPAAFTLTTNTGTMLATTTNPRSTLTAAYGSMNATYNTSLFGNVVKGTSYYVKTVNSPTTFTISATPGGSAVVLKSDTGSMNVAAVGWDHIHPGTAIQPALDNSTIYYVEPRIVFTKPGFSQSVKTINTAAIGTTWSSIGYGEGKFIAVPNGNAIAGISEDGGNTWTPLSLPSAQTWSSVGYSDGRWVIISSGGMTSSVVAYSINGGYGWRVSEMPSVSSWSHLVYGNGKFVAIASGTNKTAYSTNYGKDWTAGSGLPNATWSSLTYGKGKFVAVASSGTTAAYSNDGMSWQIATLPSSTNWSSVSYGNGLFVAVSSTDGAKPAYSSDGITWFESPYTLLSVDKIVYGQGVFVAGSNSTGTAYTTEDGISWSLRSIDSASFNAVAFGWDPATYDGIFVGVGGTTSASIIQAGARAKARVNVVSGTIDTVTIFEPGSNYDVVPSSTITDPSVTLNATTLIRLSNGVLANPTFINSGVDYNTNSTVVTINGGGYADTYQAGLRIIVKNLTALPAPGDNLVVANNSTVYKVTNATAVYGTVAPNIMANIEISPEMTVAKSPEHEAEVTIRTKYSQCRLTNHDFLNVGYGNLQQSNYPNLPTDTVLAPQDQAVEVNYGRVFYTSTDQDGNFKVGNLFGVEQATGIVTLSATQFGLTGLETLSLGGIAVGGASVIIRQFSTDTTFIANSNEIIPTQRAIKAYLTSRLSQGGANTFTGQLTAGTVVVGGADKIRSTVPEGNAGWVVNMPAMTRIHGQFAGWDGDGMALSYFMKTFNQRSGTFGR